MRRAQLLAADHERDEPVLVDLGDVPACPTRVPSRRTVTRSPIVEDLVEAVRDVDDAEALLAHAADRLEQHLDLVPRQRGGRLVDDEDPRALPVTQRAGDRDAGALRGAELGDRPADVEVVAERAHPLARVAPLGRPADAAAERRLEPRARARGSRPR